MKLELHHLAPYLPYGLKGQLQHDIDEEIGHHDWYEDLPKFKKGAIWEYSGYIPDAVSLCIDGEVNGCVMTNGYTWVSYEPWFKPILRPLTDYQDVNSQAMNDLNIDIQDQVTLTYLATKEEHYTRVSYSVIEICLRNHIDIFGLIDKGLAIDQNTLEL